MYSAVFLYSSVYITVGCLYRAVFVQCGVCIEQCLYSAVFLYSSVCTEQCTMRAVYSVQCGVCMEQCLYSAVFVQLLLFVHMARPVHRWVFT